MIGVIYFFSSFAGTIFPILIMYFNAMNVATTLNVISLALSM